MRAVSRGEALEFQHGNVPNVSCERSEKKGHKRPLGERCRCMSAMLRILNPTSFFCHDPWDYLYGGGVCVGVWTGEAIPPRRGLRYQSQRAVGRMERVDAAGRVSGWWGSAFVPTPQPGSPEKITEQADSSRLRALPSDWLRRASRCWSCSRGFGWFQLLTLTPRDGLTAPAALTHTTCWSGGPRAPSTHHTLARVTLKDGRTLSAASSHQRWTQMLPPKLCCFWNVLLLLTDRVWIHL